MGQPVSPCKDCGKIHSDSQVAEHLAEQGILEFRHAEYGDIEFRGDLDQIPKRRFMIHPELDGVSGWRPVQFVKLPGTSRRELRLVTDAN